MNIIDFLNLKRHERDISTVRKKYRNADSNSIIHNINIKHNRKRGLQNSNHAFTLPNNKINILMRCTYRPTTFEKAIQSILLQKYQNYHVYICYDDPDCLQYLNKYLTHPNITITASPNVPRNSKFFYNLYCNFLLEFVKDGWFFFLDDDDMLMSPKTLTDISNMIKNDNDIIFWKVKIGNYIVYPKNLSKLTLGAVSGIGFCINHKYKFLGKWIDQAGSDYSYINEINNSNINFNRKMIGEVLTGTISINPGNLGKKENKSTTNMKITTRNSINTNWKSLLPSIVLINKPYDTSNFKLYQKNLHTSIGKTISITGKKNLIYYIYQPNYHNIKTIYEYDMSFKLYSKYKVIYISKCDINAIRNIPDNCIVFLSYAIIHDIAVNPSTNHKNLVLTLKSKNCYKIASIQDEYYHVEHIRSLLNEIRINHILTVLDTDENIKKVYNTLSNVHNIKFTKCITGYISDTLNCYKKNISEKSIDIFYRGKKLHPLYGILGYLKWQIGEVFSIIPGLKTNISSNYADRINGDKWYETLADSKVTLASPSGSNVINLNNNYLNKICNALELARSHNIEDSQNITESYNKAYAIEPPIEILDLQVVSPKMFEAIAVGTVLVMYEGRYNNILEPNVHYIELKTDHSNIDDVISKIKDNNFLQNMADRAYNDIVASGLYSYKTFIEAFDRSLV